MSKAEDQEASNAQLAWWEDRSNTPLLGPKATERFVRRLILRIRNDEHRGARRLAALEFYAAPENWRPDDWGCVAVIAPPDYARGGEVARAAIAGGEAWETAAAAIAEMEETE